MADDPDKPVVLRHHPVHDIRQQLLRLSYILSGPAQIGKQLLRGLLQPVKAAVTDMKAYLIHQARGGLSFISAFVREIVKGQAEGLSALVKDMVCTGKAE